MVLELFCGFFVGLWYICGGSSIGLCGFGGSGVPSVVDLG